MKKSALALTFLLGSSTTFSAEWTPKPNFSIDGAGYVETLAFISGISYALTYSNAAMRSKGLPGFYCPGANIKLTSEQIINLINEKTSGEQSSEKLMQILITQLSEKYPC
ncbi:hypothetical protein ACLUTX_16050 [Enterobacterales bacterium AE_CKDN230030158-1A_HGKHYDSX7]